MGKLASMGGQKVKMFRKILRYDVSNPLIIRDIDDPHYTEDWSEGLVMYHNPYAEHPVEEQYFDISHIHYEPLENRFYSRFQPFHVICSSTDTIKIS